MMQSRSTAAEVAELLGYASVAAVHLKRKRLEESGVSVGELVQLPNHSTRVWLFSPEDIEKLAAGVARKSKPKAPKADTVSARHVARLLKLSPDVVIRRAVRLQIGTFSHTRKTKWAFTKDDIDKIRDYTPFQK